MGAAAAPETTPASSWFSTASPAVGSFCQSGVGCATAITASITNEAVDELKLAQGQSAYAVIKASDVMIALDV